MQSIVRIQCSDRVSCYKLYNKNNIIFYTSFAVVLELFFLRENVCNKHYWTRNKYNMYTFQKRLSNWFWFLISSLDYSCINSKSTSTHDHQVNLNDNIILIIGNKKNVSSGIYLTIYFNWYYSATHGLFCACLSRY